MDRKEVEALLAQTEIRYPEANVAILPPFDITIPTETLAALCRTQLAVWDAPVAELLPDSETYRGVQVDMQNSARIVVDMGQTLNIGQRVRVVPEGA